MKTTKVKSIVLIITTIFINVRFAMANIGSTLKQFTEDQASNINSEGFLIIGGIISISTFVYLLTNHLSKKEINDGITQQKTRILRGHHHKQLHSTKIIKKTS